MREGADPPLDSGSAPGCALLSLSVLPLGAETIKVEVTISSMET